MAILKIPVRSDLPAYEFQIELEENLFTLSFRYNSRMNLWIMDILTQEGSPLKMGIPVLTAVKLIEDQRPANFPKGDFLVVEDTGLFINSGREEFGTLVNLFYKESE